VTSAAGAYFIGCLPTKLAPRTLWAQQPTKLAQESLSYVGCRLSKRLLLRHFFIKTKRSHQKEKFCESSHKHIQELLPMKLALYGLASFIGSTATKVGVVTPSRLPKVLSASLVDLTGTFRVLPVCSSVHEKDSTPQSFQLAMNLKFLILPRAFFIDCSQPTLLASSLLTGPPFGTRDEIFHNLN
jgi:hypothetical protein